MKKSTFLFNRFFLSLAISILFYISSNAQPLSVTIAVIANASSCSACDGSATANVTGGTPPYMYSWVPSWSGQTISGVCPGQVGVVVFDAASGYAGDTAMITCPASGIAEISMLNRLLQIFPNPASDKAHIKLLSQNSAITSLSVINTLGESVLHKQFNNGISFDGVIFISDLPKGIYIVELTDENNLYRNKLVKQ